MRHSFDPWSQFNRSLGWYADRLRELKYEPLAAFAPTDLRLLRLKRGQLALEDIQSLLNSTAVGPPHGFELLRPFPLPDFPDFPESPPVPPKPKPVRSWFFGNTASPADPSYELIEKTIKKAEELGRQGQRLWQKFRDKFQAEVIGLQKLRKACEANILMHYAY